MSRKSVHSRVHRGPRVVGRPLRASTGGGGLEGEWLFGWFFGPRERNCRKDDSGRRLYQRLADGERFARGREQWQLGFVVPRIWNISARTRLLCEVEVRERSPVEIVVQRRGPSGILARPD